MKKTFQELIEGQIFNFDGSMALYIYQGGLTYISIRNGQKHTGRDLMRYCIISPVLVTSIYISNQH